MSSVEVSVHPENDSWNCNVVVRETDSKTSHRVMVTRQHLEDYEVKDDQVETLVEASFKFLLEREPKEAILASFELDVIEQYFPEYPDQIGEYMD